MTNTTAFKTAREFYTAVANGEMNADVQAYAVAAIAALDEKNAKRKASPSALKAQAERDEFRASVLAILTSEPQAASAIGVALGVSTAKASAALTALVKDGKAVAVDFKPDGKGRKVKGYTVAPDGAPVEG